MNVERAEYPLSFDEFLSYFTFNGSAYPAMGSGTIRGNTESIGAGFTAYIEQAYKSNGIVFACEAVRVSLFRQATFQFQRFKDGRPGDMWGNSLLNPLHLPGDGLTTGDLLAMMLLDADFGGNAFVNRRLDRLVRLRPDWTTIVWRGTSVWDLDGEVAGYLYQEGGPSSGNDPVALDANAVAHFMPTPDPLAPRRGMSWLTPVVREVMSDGAFTNHKNAFMQNGATVNLVMEYDKDMAMELYNAAVDSFEAKHEGPQNAGKALHLLGATAKAVGADMQQMDFKSVQGAGETRIAAASGVHPAIVALSEGMQGASLNAGNFAAARRLTADKCLRPLWSEAAASLAHIIDVPSGSVLAADVRDVAFLREDEKDAAEIQEVQARTITTYVNAGYESDSVIAAVAADDMTKLKHSGLLSVQLQPPGTVAKPTQPALPGLEERANGNGHLDAAAKV